MRVERWCLWYEDGTSVEGSTQHEWDAAPTDRVIYGMLFFGDGTAAHLNALDLYWSQDFGQGQVFAHDSDRDSLLRRLRFVKFGCWTSTQQFTEAQQKAIAAADAWTEAINGKPPEKCAGCGGK